jgi:drug/metabolite transporter (DMT)-like permease
LPFLNVTSGENLLLSPHLAAAGFALAAILCWGSADFIGGYGTRSTDSFLLTTVAHFSALVLMTSVAWAHGDPFPSHASALWAVAAGTSGGVALALFYQALASGKMGLNAPVSAVLGAAIPVGVSFVTEGLPSPIQIAGFMLAVVGVWLVSKPDNLTGRPEGLGLAMVAGLGFAGFFLCIRQAGNSSALWSAALTRVASLALVSVIVLIKLLQNKLRRGMMATAGIAAGILDVSGTFFFIRASQSGRLDVAVVLVSLYPVITVLLAKVFLKEHFTPIKLAGMIAALLAMPMIALR